MYIIISGHATAQALQRENRVKSRVTWWTRWYYSSLLLPVLPPVTATFQRLHPYQQTQDVHDSPDQTAWCYDELRPGTWLSLTVSMVVKASILTEGNGNERNQNPTYPLQKCEIHVVCSQSSTHLPLGLVCATVIIKTTTLAEI